MALKTLNSPRTMFLALLKLFALSLVLAAPGVLAGKKAATEKPQVVFKTSHGDILIELFPDKAPITVANFLRYVDEGFYNGTIFHRVIPGFVAQGGGFTFDFQRKKTHDPIKNEADNGLKNLAGTLSMARTSVIDSATTQFFINLANNRPLDHSKSQFGYAVFARVIKGRDVIKKIVKEPRGAFQNFPDAPNYAVVIETASRVTTEQKKTKEQTK